MRHGGLIPQRLGQVVLAWPLCCCLKSSYRKAALSFSVNEGKSFQVPTISTSCQKTSYKAIRWIVAVFHSFKTHLNPIALKSDSGRVLPVWVRLYQNNFLIHIQGQGKALSLPTRPSAPRKADSPRTPTQGSSPATMEVAKLFQELSDLRREFTEFQQAHMACYSPSVPLSSPPSSLPVVPAHHIQPWLWHVKNHPEFSPISSYHRRRGPWPPQGPL